MVTWGAFVAKMIEFAASKILGKELDFRFDEKKRAARTFLRLNQLVGELSKLTKKIIVEIDLEDRDNYRVEKAWLSDLDEDLRNISNDFFRVSSDLHELLEIFDPDLSVSLMQLNRGKFSILIIASQGFKCLFGRDSLGQIEYTYPHEDMLSIDFEEHYRWVRENGMGAEFEELKWPQNVLLGFHAERFELFGTLSGKESDQYNVELDKLLGILRLHSEALDNTSEILSRFIEKNFTILDVMYCNRR